MTGAADLPWWPRPQGLLVRVRVTPKASRDVVEGIETTAEGSAIKVRVRAVPADGAANAAVEKLVAAWLGVPKSSVQLSAGSKSRIKTLAIAGDGPTLAADAAARLEVLSGPKTKETQHG